MQLLKQNKAARRPARTGAIRAATPLLALTGLCMTALLAGCHSQAGGQISSATPSSADSVIAKVNDDSITMGQLYDFMQRLPLTDTAQAMQTLPQGWNVGELALFQLIQQDLIIQFAKDQGVPVTDQEVNDSYNDAVLTNQIQTTWPYDQVLALQGYTPDTYKRDVVRFQVAQFNLLTKNDTVTQQEIQAGYNADKDTRYSVPAAVHIERVVVPTQAEAEDIYKKASQGAALSTFQSENQAPATPGADSADVPQWLDMSTNPANQNDLMIAMITSHLKSAKVGQVVAPFQVGSSWWVVKVLALRPKSVLPFDEVKNAVRTNVLSQKTTPEDRQSVVQDLKNYEQHAVLQVPQQDQEVVQQIRSPAPQAPVSAPVAPAPEPSAPPRKK